MKVSRRVIVPLVMLLGLLLVVAAVATKVETEDPEDESWTSWAKDKIGEGLGFKEQTDEEEAGEAVESTGENTQETISGESIMCTCFLVLFSSSF